MLQLEGSLRAWDGTVAVTMAGQTSNGVPVGPAAAGVSQSAMADAAGPELMDQLTRGSGEPRLNASVAATEGQRVRRTICAKL